MQKMKMKFFKDDENISCEFIVNNIENSSLNKITTINIWRKNQGMIKKKN